MSDVNWDLAPEGATEIRSNGNIMRFFNEHNHLWNGAAKEWVIIPNEYDWKTIATRPQERNSEYPPLTQSLIDEANQDEEWTHVMDSGEKCIVLADKPDIHGVIVIYTDDNNYYTCEPSNIKPIKPQITKAKAWDRLNSGEFYNAQYGIDTLKHEYEIID